MFVCRALSTLLALGLGLATAQQVTLPNGGIVTGTLQTNAAGDHIQAYRGIPYAEPPVGDRRWKQATLKPLNASLSATALGKICYGDGRVDSQSSAYPSSEDCLFLNVYAPVNTTSESKLPVMVWIHGGSFVAGASNIYDGSNLIGAAHNNLLVVTLNYRLSVFGLLSGDALKHEGTGVNYALRDQEVAFQWVQQYISLFGGDANNITAFGESAGAKSVFAHLISRGGRQQLFHRAIMQSGTYTTAHDVPSKEQQNAVFSQIASQLGCNSASVLDCMRAANSSAVWAAGGLLPGWQPVVDGVFLLEPPLTSLLAGKVSRVPTIIGTNTDEGWTFTTAVTTPEAVMPYVRTKFAHLTEAEFALVDALYPPENFPTASHRISQIYGDAIYVCPSELTSLALALEGNATPTYRYRFNQTSLTYGTPLAVHTADIIYVFNIVSRVGQDPATQAFVADVQRYWTSFASSNVPSSAGSASLTWPKYDAHTRQQILLQASGLALETTGAYMPVHAERCAFWNAVELRLSPSLCAV